MNSIRVRSVLYLVLAAFPILFFAGTLHAQSAGNSGQIVGQVLDPSSASIAGAEVTVRNKNTNFTRSTTTDDAGRYAVSLLPLGPYGVMVKASGFDTKMQEAFVTLGSSVSANFRLAMQARTESVEVTAQAPGIEPTRTAAKSILTELQIHQLPSNGRRVQNFVIQTPAALIEPECRGFSISGQKGIYGNVSIDGGDYNSTWSCGIRGRSESAPSFGLEALQEVHVVRNTFSAEFGRSTGGEINLSTRSGTNQQHGSAYELFKNGDLSAQDAFNRRSIAKVNQFGGSLGGPLAQDRTFFFVAPEFQFGSKPVQVLYSVLDSQNLRNTSGAQALLSVAPEGPFNAISNSQSVISRLDHRFSGLHSFFGRFDFTRTVQTNSPGATALSTGLGIASTTTAAVSNQLTQPDSNYTVLGQLTSALSSTYLNELRGQFSRESRPRVHLGTGPQVTVNSAGSPVATYGTVPEGSWGNAGFASTDNRYQIVDNFSAVSAAHTAKIGFDFIRIAGDALYDQTSGGAYTFNNLTDLLNRSPAIYTQFTGSGRIAAKIHQLGVYVQDEWRIFPGLTLTPGLRYDAQFNPAYFPATAPQNRYRLATSIPNDTRMFAPRLGLAWDVNNSGKTVIRLGGGLFYAPTFLAVFTQSMLFNGGNPERAYSATVNNPAALTNAFQSVGANLQTAPLNDLPVFSSSQFARLLAAGAGLNAVSFMDPLFRNPRALQWQAGIEREITRAVTISENFTYINTARVLRQRDTNLGAAVADATGRSIYSNPRPFPAFGVAQVTESGGRSLYRGFTTTVNIRRNRYTMDVYYTRSWNYTFDDTERGFTAIRYADVNNIKSEYNFSNVDEPHQFLVNGNYSLPLGFEIGTTMRFIAGRPYNAVVGQDLNRDANNTDRPIVNGVMLLRNAFRNSGLKDVSLRVQKNFSLSGEKRKLSVSAEMFNLFNFANVQLAGGAFTYGPGAVFQNGVAAPQAPPAPFGKLKNPQGQYYQYNAGGDPFQAQLGLRLEF